MIVSGLRSRFQPDPEALIARSALPSRWKVRRPDPDDPAEVERVCALLRAQERAGRGWASATEDGVRRELSAQARGTRENAAICDPAGLIRAWGSAYDRASGRMVFGHVLDRGPDEAEAQACSRALTEWALGQAELVGAARGVARQQVDISSFADDAWQHRLLAADGFEKVRTWWQMSRTVAAEESRFVENPMRWQRDGVVIRLVDADPDGAPHATELQTVHEVIEEAFADHFNHKPETFDEFLVRMREAPGHRWDHWWLAEVDGRPAGALVGAAPSSPEAGSGSRSVSHITYIGVLASARGRGVATGLLRTVIADAANRGRGAVTLEVDAASPTGADRLYRRLGWEVSYMTESWHRTVPVSWPVG